LSENALTRTHEALQNVIEHQVQTEESTQTAPTRKGHLTRERLPVSHDLAHEGAPQYPSREGTDHACVVRHASVDGIRIPDFAHGNHEHPRKAQQRSKFAVVPRKWNYDHVWNIEPIIARRRLPDPHMRQQDYLLNQCGLRPKPCTESAVGIEVRTRAN
jgi:hypothetical protein